MDCAPVENALLMASIVFEEIFQRFENMIRMDQFHMFRGCQWIGLFVGLKKGVRREMPSSSREAMLTCSSGPTPLDT